MLVTPVISRADLALARAEVAVALTDLDLDPGHVADVEVVAHELLDAAIDAGGAPLRLFVEPARASTFVRVRCERYLPDARTEIDLRERVFGALAMARGRHRNALGTTDLWAEVPHLSDWDDERPRAVHSQPPRADT